MNNPVHITIHGPDGGKEDHEIVAFSMREPSTNHFRFQTVDGRTLESHGCVLTYRGDIDALPSAL